jgi:CDP-glucose 4,6-dehydratase
LSSGEPLHLRNPGHIRPWQHVLEALSGYLWLATRLLEEGGVRFAEAWNFGPDTVQGVTTEMLVQKVLELWGRGTYTKGEASTERETHWLRLNWDKSALQLGWRPAYSWKEALSATVAWYQEYQDQIASGEPVDMYPICAQQIQAYTDRARHQRVGWAGGEPPAGRH